MGRSLRSGRQLKSLSPPNKGAGARKPNRRKPGTTNVGTAAAAAPAKPRGRGPKGGGKAAAPARGRRRKEEEEKAAAAAAAAEAAAAAAEEAAAAAAAEAAAAEAAAAEKDESSSGEESSDDEAEKTDPVPPEEGESSSDEEGSDEVAKKAPVPLRRCAAEKDESSSDEESSDDEVQGKAPAPLKKSAVDKERSASDEERLDDESSSEEESSGGEVAKKAPTPRNKRAAEKGESSSEEESSDEVAEKAPTPLKRSATEKEESSSEESSSDEESANDEVEEKAPAPLKKSTNEKERSSSDEENSVDKSSSEEESSEDEVAKKAPTPLKRSAAEKDESSSEEASSDDDDSKGSDDDESSVDSQDNEKNTGYTDDNSKWLKPKQTKQELLSSDEDEEGDDLDLDAKAADSDDNEEMLDIERQSRIIDAEMEQEREEAEAELRHTIAKQTSTFRLPTREELEEDKDRVVPPSELRERIEDVLEVLGDFRARREQGRSRTEYVERVGEDMSELFGYLPELVEYFLSMFGPAECLEFLEASDRPRPLVVRVNTLRARRKDLAAALIKRGVRLDPLAPWSKVGLKIHESAVPVGATPEYLAGHYMLQSAASMCPVMALGPLPGDRVLDMSAAPGGKTSYISQLMRNKGVVIANDLKPERQKATVANLHRLGVRNVITCCLDGRKLGGQKMRNSFDRILLDAPCSGLGVISRDPSVKVQRTMPDVKRCAHLQKELLVAAIDALNHKSKKGGGYMVYSTCSVAVAENEEVVNYLLSKRDVKFVDTGLDFGASSLFLPSFSLILLSFMPCIEMIFCHCRQTRVHPF